MLQSQAMVAVAVLLALMHRTLQHPTRRSTLDGSGSDSGGTNASNKTGDFPSGYNISNIPRPCEVDNGGCTDLCVPEGEKGTAGLHCRCRMGSRLLGDGRTCTECHTVLPMTLKTGRVASQGVPAKLNCTWAIQPMKRHFLKITFHSIDIKSSNCCLDNYLEILQPDRHSSSSGLVHNPPLRRRICGFYRSMSFYWVGKFVLNFRTVHNSFHKGFRMSYENVLKTDPSISFLSELEHVDIRGGPTDQLQNCRI